MAATPMDLTPGTVLLADWDTGVMLFVGDDGRVAAESLKGRQIAVRDTEGVELDHVIACSPVLGLAVRMQLRSGRPFVRLDPDTGEEVLAVICEHRAIGMIEEAT